MGIQIDALKCNACMACELACGYHRDDAFALLSMQMMDLLSFYRMRSGESEPPYLDEVPF